MRARFGVDASLVPSLRHSSQRRLPGLHQPLEDVLRERKTDVHRKRKTLERGRKIDGSDSTSVPEGGGLTVVGREGDLDGKLSKRRRVFREGGEDRYVAGIDDESSDDGEGREDR